MAAKTQQMTLQRAEFIKQLFSPEIMFNATDAYKIAYPKCKSGNANRLANRLMSYDVIKLEIAKQRAQIAKETGFSIERAQQMYEEDRDFARSCRQSGAAVTATTGICRLYGMDKDAGGGEKTVIIISPKVPEPRKPITSKEIENEVQE